jgi:hypothetical protein
MNQIFVLFVTVFPFSNQSDLKTSDDYYQRLERHLVEVVKQEKIGGHSGSELKAVASALELMRKTDLKKIEKPLVLWYRIINNEKKLLAVYWAFEKPVGSEMTITLKSGGTLKFKVLEDYQKVNLETYAAGEPMYAVFQLTGEEYNFDLSEKDIAKITVD